MNHLSLAPFVAPMLFGLVFVIVWLGITGGLAQAAGWANLAVNFRQRNPLLGESFTSVSGAMGKGRFPVGYRSCLSVVVGDEGFSIGVLFPFRFRSPPLFVHWSQVESVAEESKLFTRYTAVHIRGASQVIFIRGPAGQCIRECYERGLQQPAR